MAYFTENYIPALLEFCSTSFSVCFIQDSRWIMLQGKAILNFFMSNFMLLLPKQTQTAKMAFLFHSF